MNGSSLQAVETTIEDGRNCFQFFGSQDFDINSRMFKTQLWYLTKMAYVSLKFLREELRENASAGDAMKAQMEVPSKGEYITTKEKQIINTNEEEIINTTKEEEIKNTTEMDKIINTTENEEISNTTEDEDISTTTEQETNTIKKDSFISNVLNTIKKVAPNHQYKPKHLRRKKFKVVPFEFASIWRNISRIFPDEKEEAPSSIPESALPRVAWEKVNKGALKKLPTPTLYPVQSVSPDASLYGKSCGCAQFYMGDPSPCSCKTTFEKKNPFGTLQGFETNLGIVPVPSTPLFGYIWDQDKGDWILHAEVSSHDNNSDLQSPKRSRRTPDEGWTRARTRGRTRKRPTRRRRTT